MAYNEHLARRIRLRLIDLPDIEEKEMFGGVAFMVNGKMCVGVIKDEMMCRIDPAAQDQAVERTGCRVMDFNRRPMRGFVMIDDSGMASKKDFEHWIGLALEFNTHAKPSRKKR
jgi:TfoX/Sxy family transcriptional regulator of competence genes